MTERRVGRDYAGCLEAVTMIVGWVSGLRITSSTSIATLYEKNRSRVIELLRFALQELKEGEDELGRKGFERARKVLRQ